MTAPGKGRNQRRLAGAGRADKGDATARNVNGSGMERDNSALMTQKAEHRTEQVDADLVFICGRCRVYEDFFPAPHKKTGNVREIDQYFLSVVGSEARPVAQCCRSPKRVHQGWGRGGSRHHHALHARGRAEGREAECPRRCASRRACKRTFSCPVHNLYISSLRRLLDGMSRPLASAPDSAREVDGLPRRIDANGAG